MAYPVLSLVVERTPDRKDKIVTIVKVISRKGEKSNAYGKVIFYSYSNGVLHLTMLPLMHSFIRFSRNPRVGHVLI